MNRFVAISASALAAFSLTASASTVYSTYLDGLVQQDGKGLYDEVLRVADVPHKALPAARASKTAIDSKGCLFPLDPRFADSSVRMVGSRELARVKIVLVRTSDGASKVDAGARVGVRRGLNLGPKVAQTLNGTTMDYADTLAQNVTKLLAGKTDAIVEFELDLMAFLKAHPQLESKLSWDSARALDEHYDAVSCVDTPENRALLKVIDDKLSTAKARIEVILGAPLPW